MAHHLVRRLRSNPFTAPGEHGRGVWRALAEVAGSGVLMLLTGSVVSELDGRAPGDAEVLFGGVALVLLAVRRRWPKATMLGSAALVGALPAAGLLTAVVAYTTARLLAVPRQRTVVLLVSTGLALLTATFVPERPEASYLYGLALGAVLAATTLVVPGLVGTSAGQQDRLLRALGERAAAAEEARRLADSESRTHERSRIAAEMHDLVGHRLSLISLHSGGLEMALADRSPELRDEAALVRRATRDAMRELREVLGVLGPLGRDTGPGALTDATGTRSDIEALAEESRRGGIPVELDWEGPDLDVRSAQVRRAVHRVVRECLTNVHRYAAGARVTVSVSHTEEWVRVALRNEAPPVPPEARTGLGTGRGLAGLRERVTLLGGDLEAKPTAVGGFAVTARVPAEPGPGAPFAGADEFAGTDEPARAAPVTEARPGRTLFGVQRRVVGVLTSLLGLTGVGVMMLFGLALVEQSTPRAAPRHYDEPRVGMSREDVRDAVPGDSVAMRAAATGREPDRPEGATSCMYPTDRSEDFVPEVEFHGPGAAGPPDGAAEGDGTGAAGGGGEPGGARVIELPRTGYGPGQLTITRYCFRGDKLAAIDRFTVPTVSQKPPWETP